MNTHVFKEVVCQWPPFGSNFPKRGNILSNHESRKIFLALDWIKC